MALFEWDATIRSVGSKILDDAINYCKMTMPWPPSICEFIEICENLSGMPSVDSVIALALRGDFSNPIVKMIYDDIGSWNFSRDTEKDLRKKVERSFSKIKNQSRLRLLELSHEEEL